MHDKRKPYRLTHTPRPCQRTPRPAAKVLRGVCSEAAGWAAWHRCRARVQAFLRGEGGLATRGVYRLMGPDGEMARIEV